MSSRDPGFSGALERAGQTILDSIIKKAQLDFQREQLEVEKQALQLQRDKFGEDQRVNAFLMFDKLVPFMKVGVPLAEQPVFHDVMRTMLPGQDPADPDGLGGIDPNPVTFDTIRQALAQEWALLPDSPEKERVKSRIINKDLIGEPLSPDELSLRDNTVEFQARSLDAIANDPDVMVEAGRVAQGLEAATPLTINLAGKRFTIPPTTAANIWAQLHMQTRELNFRKENPSGGVDRAGELMSQMKDAGIVISRPNADAIIRAVESENPQAAVDAISQGASKDMLAAIGTYLWGAKLSDLTKSQFRRDNPRLDFYLELREDMEKSFTKEEITKFSPMIARAVNEATGYDRVPRPDRFQWYNPLDWFGKWGLSGDFFGPGTEADARNDAMEYRAGRMSAGDLLRKWQDPETVRAIVQTSQQLEESRR